MRIAIFALAGALMFTGCNRSGSSSSSSSSPVPHLTERAAAAVAQGRLTAGRDGVVTLPATLQGGSSDQKAYVKRETTGAIWVLLPTASDSGFKGWLYCTKPPAEKPSKVQVIGPKAGGGAGAMEVTVDSSTSDGWYSVHAGG